MSWGSCAKDPVQFFAGNAVQQFLQPIEQTVFIDHLDVFQFFFDCRKQGKITGRQIRSGESVFDRSSLSDSYPREGSAVSRVSFFRVGASFDQLAREYAMKGSLFSVAPVESVSTIWDANGSHITVNMHFFV
jgi:hypothetical protein